VCLSFFYGFVNLCQLTEWRLTGKPMLLLLLLLLQSFAINLTVLSLL
jgi:hypothetical protein